MITSCPLPQNEAERLNTLVSLQPEFTPLDGQFSAGANRQLGWQPRGDYPHHRLHDLRHTFVVRATLRFYQQGIDVDRAVLALSTYIGHAKVSDTYWYFTGIPELMAIAAERFERYAEGAPQ